jgi:uncharacterized membrane protein
MRSSRNALVAGIALALAGCGTEVDHGAVPDPVCEASALTYDNFGGPFVLDWCRGCHSSALPDGMRQGAPLGVDFDDLDLVRGWSPEIQIRAAGPDPTMPPAAGPSLEERAMLSEWISCGMQ